jgi:hypothetical protein
MLRWGAEHVTPLSGEWKVFWGVLHFLSPSLMQLSKKRYNFNVRGSDLPVN